jgi:sulfur dioxygenase
MSSLIFRGLFDRETWTYSYIIADPKTQEALIIDPVRNQVDRDLRILTELNLTLRYVFDTHIHADHITGSGILKERTGAKTVMNHAAGLAVDIAADNGDKILLGDTACTILTTPGHTTGCASLLVEDIIFTGDTLLIRKTGRTDFQDGSASNLYDSIMTKIYSLPNATKIYPGHDYTGQTVSSVGEEKIYNERIRAGTSREEFVQTMSKLKLDYPKYIDVALPANNLLGIV